MLIRNLKTNVLNWRVTMSSAIFGIDVSTWQKGFDF